MKDFWLTPSWPAPNNVFAITTLKETSDNYLQRLPAPPIWLKQVHGIEVVCADNQFAKFPEADAAIAFKKDVVCAIRTADCLPILVCDKQGTQVAAIHAGWRGLAAGIIPATLNKLRAHKQDCMAWLGPAIGPQHFEVGQDVLDSFLSQGWEPSQVEKNFLTHPANQNKWLVDLYSLARVAFGQAGISADNIYGGEWCTYSDPGRFYSYRRSADSGRMATLIWRR